MNNTAAADTGSAMADQADVPGKSRTCGCNNRGGRNIGWLLYSDTVGALQYDDYKGPNRQYVNESKLVIEIWKS